MSVPSRLALCTASAAALIAVLSACSASATAASASGGATPASSGAASAGTGPALVVYSAQGYDDPVTKAFTAATGIPVKLVDDSTGPLLTKVAAE